MPAAARHPPSAPIATSAQEDTRLSRASAITRSRDFRPGTGGPQSDEEVVMTHRAGRVVITAVILAVPPAMAWPGGRSPRAGATEVLFASDEAALEPHLLRST